MGFESQPHDAILGRRTLLCQKQAHARVHTCVDMLKCVLKIPHVQQFVPDLIAIMARNLASFDLSFLHVLTSELTGQ